jgi:hypothetical protein
MINKNKLLKRTGLFVLIGLLFLIGLFVIFYFLSPLKSWNKMIFEVAPYPVAWVDGEIITTRDVLKNTDSLRNFYETQDFSEIGMRVDFKTEDGKKRLKIKEKEVFNKLVENILVEKIANVQGIQVDKREAEQEIVTKAKEVGSTENLALNLKRLYGWSLKDFRDKIVIPKLYLSRLIDYYEQEVFDKKSNSEKIEKAYQELLKRESDFESVAKQYSEGETAEQGGNLGWFKKEYLSEKIGEKAYSMQVGEFSEIIRTSLGSHIIYLDEVRGEGDEKEVKIKQIFTNEGSFLDWLNEQKSQYSVRILTREYFWDRDDCSIEFSEESLKEMESELRSKASGDPSFY